MNLKGIMLSKRSQSQRVNSCMISFTQTFLKKKSYSGEEQIRLPRVRAKRGITIKGKTKEFFGVAGLFCILYIMVIIPVYTCVNVHRTVHLKKSKLQYNLKIKFIRFLLLSGLSKNHLGLPHPISLFLSQ